MNKLFKKIAACFTAFVMMFFAVGSVNVFATPEDESEPQTYSITIKNPYANHTYSAYKIFNGTLSEDKETLSNIDWDSGLTDTGKLFLAKEVGLLTADATSMGTVTATDVAEKLAEKSPEEVAEIAKKLSTSKDGNYAYLNTCTANATSGDKTEGATSPKLDSEIKINGLTAGYYVVIDSYTNKEGKPDSVSMNMLQVVSNSEVSPKTDVPTIEKKIIENNAPVDANKTGIGTTVNYKLQSEVPNMENYVKYQFVMKDTMSAGLTLIDSFGTDGGTDGFKVMVGETQLTRSTLGNDGSVNKVSNTDGTEITTTFAVEKNTDSTGITTFSIIFHNFIQYAKNTDITVEYSATLNENAVIGVNGNPNKIELEFSNNPNVAGEGLKDKPQPGDVTGTTPEDIVKTYVTGIKLNKVDGDGNPLKGAEFTISGISTQKVVKKTNNFTQNVDGTYYKLIDGTYTETAPVTGPDAEGYNGNKYADTTTKYKAVLETRVIDVTENIDLVVIPDENGKITIDGLANGDYTVKESKTPDGYNTIPEFTITISGEVPSTITTGSEQCTWTITQSENSKVSLSDNIFTITNTKGAELPETGGMGTTMLYIAGGILVLGSVLFFMTNRKMNKR